LASGSLEEVLADYQLEPMTAYAVFPAGRRLSQKARAFSDYLQRALMSDA
jgi:DNA-binding transcriptional LysR family regulator